MLRARRRTRIAGFTLLELIAVVAIISVVAALAAPQIGGALAENRTTRAQLDIVRLVRLARSRAAGYGRAHLLYFEPTGNSGLGQMEVWQGVSNRCAATNWAALGVGGAATACGPSAFCWDNLDTIPLGNTSNRYQVTGVPAGAAQICFEPDGRALHRSTSAQVWSNSSLRADGANVAGAYTFVVTRLVGGTQRGVQRRVLLPLGGDARVIR